MSDSDDSGSYSSNDEAESGFYIQKEQPRFRPNHWEDPDEEEYEEDHKSKRRKGNRNVRFSNGIGGPGFVPSTTTAPAATSSVQEEDDDNAKKFHSLLHIPAETKRNEDFKKFVAAREPVVVSKQADPEALNKVGTWEKHTKGFGKKMLEKFGFKGRLGAKENGVSAAIEVKVRPGTIGLGFGDFSESSTLETNKKLAAEIQGKEYIPKEEAKKRMPITEARAQSKSWKLGGVTITEASEAKSTWKMPQTRKETPTVETATPKQIIVDMRGPTQRIISDVSSTGLTYYDQKPDVATKLLGQELLYNLNLVVDMDEMEVYHKNRKLNMLHETLKSFESDKNTLQQEHDSALAAHRRTQRIDATLSDFTTQLAARTLSRQHVEASLLALQEGCEEDMTLLGVAQCIPSIARVIIQQQIDVWDVTADPTFPLVVFTDWLGTISTVTSETMHESLQDAMTACVEKLQRYIMNSWDVYDPSVAVVAVASVKEVVAGPKYKEFVELILMPKLTRAVTSWNPKRDSIPIHSWLLPWVPVLRSQLASLYPDIRRKLASALSTWNPIDTSAYYMIEPFAAVFDSNSMEAFLGRAILPKLIIAFRQQPMEPGQSTAAFEAVLRWSDIIPEMHLVAMIEGEYFPRWFQVLAHWLSHRHVNFAEVALWYQSWRNLFPVDLLKHPRITLHFSYAIEAMSFALSRVAKQQTISVADIMSRIPLPLHKDYFTIIQERKLEKAAEKQLFESHQLKRDELGGFSTTAPADISFRDVVEEFAIENNVEFAPKLGQMHDGKPLWLFGNVTCYIDQHVVFAQVKENERYIWKPLALESLLALTR